MSATCFGLYLGHHQAYQYKKVIKEVFLYNIFVCNKCNLILILLTWRIRWASNIASKWQMGFNLAFKGL